MAKILVVDDSDVVRGQLRSLLQSIGHEVIESADGVQGLENAKSKAIDLIITDLNMPKMNGLQMAGEIRQLPQYSETHILMLTTETGIALKKKGKEVGIRSWIVKPIDEEVIKTAVNKLLECA